MSQKEKYNWHKNEIVCKTQTKHIQTQMGLHKHKYPSIDLTAPLGLMISFPLSIWISILLPFIRFHSAGTANTLIWTVLYQLHVSNWCMCPRAKGLRSDKSVWSGSLSILRWIRSKSEPNYGSLTQNTISRAQTANKSNEIGPCFSRQGVIEGILKFP